MLDITCPYCLHDQDVEHDSAGYEEGVKHEYDCHYCDRTFLYQTTISIHYDAYCASGAHTWGPWQKAGKDAVIRYCRRTPCQEYEVDLHPKPEVYEAAD